MEVTGPGCPMLGCVVVCRDESLEEGNKTSDCAGSVEVVAPNERYHDSNILSNIIEGFPEVETICCESLKTAISLHSPTGTSIFIFNGLDNKPSNAILLGENGSHPSAEMEDLEPTPKETSQSPPSLVSSKRNKSLRSEEDIARDVRLRRRYRHHGRGRRSRTHQLF